MEMKSALDAADKHDKNGVLDLISALRSERDAAVRRAEEAETRVRALAIANRELQAVIDRRLGIHDSDSPEHPCGDLDCSGCYPP